MHFQLIVGLIGLSMISCLNLAAAGPLRFNETGFYSELNTRTASTTPVEPPYQCSLQEQNVLRAAGDEVMGMLGRTVDRTKALLNYLQLNPRPDPNQQDPELISTAKTFESIFGYILQSQGLNPNVQKILGKAETLLNSLGSLSSMNDGRIQIFCSDWWLMNQDGWEQTRGQFFYWDGKREHKSQDWINTAETNGICRDNPKLKGVTSRPMVPSSFSQIPEKPWVVVTMCQDWMPNWVTGWNSKNTLSRARTVYQGPEKSLDYFVTTVISTTLIHELTHVANLFGGVNNVFVDTKCNGLKAYGWQCVTDLPKVDLSGAGSNADSFTFYATAMYLDNYDWSTGQARPLS